LRSLTNKYYKCLNFLGVPFFLSRGRVELLSTVHLGRHGSLKERLATTFQFRPGAAEVLEVTGDTTAAEVVSHVVAQFRIQAAGHFHLLEQRQAMVQYGRVQCGLVVCSAAERTAGGGKEDV
jgi:hypothetical protein